MIMGGDGPFRICFPTLFPTPTFFFFQSGSPTTTCLCPLRFTRLVHHPLVRPGHSYSHPSFLLLLLFFLLLGFMPFITPAGHFETFCVTPMFTDTNILFLSTCVVRTLCATDTPLFLPLLPPCYSISTPSDLSTRVAARLSSTDRPFSLAASPVNHTTSTLTISLPVSPVH